MKLHPVSVAAVFASLAAVVAPVACTTETIIYQQPHDGGIGAASDGAAPTAEAEDADTTTAVDKEDAGMAEMDASIIHDASHPTDARKDSALPPGDSGAHPPIPLMGYAGGALLTAVKIVTVTYDSDAAMRPRLETFGDTITSTPWWSAVTEGYCVTAGNCIGPGSGGGHVHVAQAPAAKYTDDQLKVLIQSMVTAGTLPAPTQQTLYSFYFPQNVTISLDGAVSCQQFGAYHNEVSVTPPGGAAITVAYAIMPRCGGEQDTTLSASHEFIEAATDAHPFSAPGYTIADWGWGFLGGEVGDVCVDIAGQDDHYVESSFVVQRSWSNVSAAGSHDPCVPAPSVAYFNAAPAKQEIALAVGTSVTIDVTGFSDGPMGAWSLSAKELGQFVGTPNVLEVSVDKATLRAGETAKLTVKLVTAIQGGAAPFAIVSKAGTRTHIWPLVVIPQ